MHTNPSRPESIVDISLSVMRHNSKSIPTKEQILSDICEIFHVDEETIKGKARPGDIVKIRHIFFYVTAFILNKRVSLKEIGQFIGGRDHATVINARENMKGYIDNKDAYIWDHWRKYTTNSRIWQQYLL